jgi:membrane protease YdiL (CAAX protease family)
VSGIVFASAHISLAWHKTFVPIFIIAAVFAAAYYKSGNILSTIAAHGVFNTISFIGLTQCDPDDGASLMWARDMLAGAMGR